MKVWSYVFFLGGLSMLRCCSMENMKKYRRIVVW